MATLNIVVGDGDAFCPTFVGKITEYVDDDIQMVCLSNRFTVEEAGVSASVALFIPRPDEKFMVVELPLKVLQMAVEVFVKEREQAIEH
jgi:hypothetical protein